MRARLDIGFDVIPLLATRICKSLRIVVVALFMMMASPHALAASALGVTPAAVDLGNIQNPLGSRPVDLTLTNTGTVDISFGWSLPPEVNYPSFPCVSGVGGDAIFVIHPGQSCLFGIDVIASQIMASDVLGPGSSTLQIQVNGGQEVVPDRKSSL